MVLKIFDTYVLAQAGVGGIMAMLTGNFGNSDQVTKKDLKTLLNEIKIINDDSNISQTAREQQGIINSIRIDSLLCRKSALHQKFPIKKQSKKEYSKSFFKSKKIYGNIEK